MSESRGIKEKIEKIRKEHKEESPEEIEERQRTEEDYQEAALTRDSEMKGEKGKLEELRENILKVKRLQKKK